MVFKEFIKDFLAESREILARLDEDFVAVERDPGDAERLDSIYGGIHTIKGSAGFFAFSKLENLAHAGESLLSDVTEGKLAIGQNIISPLLAMVDAIREMLDQVEATGADGENDFPDLMAMLSGLRSASQDAPAVNWEPAERELTEEPSLLEVQPTESHAPEPPPTPPVASSPPSPGLPQKDSKPSAAQQENTVRRSAGTIRVSVSLLDALMSLVGELVLARNQVMQYGAQLHDRTRMASFQQLDLITRELQQAIMQTRMQPIRTIFSKFPRVVRDLAVACQKSVILNLEGEDTELDKSLIEGISAPLTHLVRNCVDHGIETAAARLQAGKPAEGRVRMSAYHASGHVNIEIEDDGRGIDLEKLRNKAVTRGIITPEQAGALSESETLNLIFETGLSTAEQVSNVSGRGMGMDVVRSSLAGIRGSVDVKTVLGQGTTVHIKVPLTLAIIPALVVSCGTQKYAIPQINLQEVVCLQGKDAVESVERIYDTPVYRLRGRLLPLLYLSRELGLLSSPKASDLPAPGDGPLHIVVLSLDEHQFGLVVEAIHDTQEIVVKPIGTLLRGQGCFAGATIMDDGKPALILDILQVAQRARVLTDILDKPIFKVLSETTVAHVETEALLLFETPDGARMALPVDSVGRLELLPATSIEHTGKRDVIQDRGKILPLVNVLSLLDGNRQDYPRGRDDLIPVVVHEFGDVLVGLVVGRILDITECTVEPPAGPSRRGVLGTRIVLGRATEMLDPEALVQLADSHLAIVGPQALPGVGQHG